MRASLNLGELGELMLQIEEQEPALLILSCEKHRYTRLKKYGLNENQINNWKVIKVIIS